METPYWKHIRAVVALPLMVTVVIPVFFVVFTGSFNPGWGLERASADVIIMLGIGLLVAGLGLLFKSIILFIQIGDGTIAPWDPTRRLVVADLYGYTRNPMYTGVIFLLGGEALYAGSVWLFGWLLAVVVGFNLFIRFYEEPALLRTYGDEYVEYMDNVPRWTPRYPAWEPPFYPRTDGLYAHDAGEEGYIHYLRFFEDGMVVGTSSIGSPREVAPWLRSDHKISGEYFIEGRRITFSLNGQDGSVSYEGVVYPDGLALSAEGEAGEREYDFRAVQ